MSRRQWGGSTFGNGWMHANLIRILRHVDTRVLYVFSDIFVVPFCLLFNKSRKYSYRFFRNSIGCGFWKSCWFTYRNHCLFAQVVIDRFAMYAGKRFDVSVEGIEQFKELESKDEGFIHLSSHIGNYEIAGYTLNSTEKKIYAVVYPHEKESVTRNREHMFSKTNVDMIAMGQDMAYLYEIDSAISNGDIVSFPSDRFMEGSRYIELSFLGKKAKFPLGPFSVTTMRGVEVLAVNVMKTGLGKYRIFVTRLPYDKSAGRSDQIRQLSRAYVSELEKMVRQYPLQWFNLYEFWS